jgi:hypothetical protein
LWLFTTEKPMKTKLLSLALLAAFAVPASAQTYGGSSTSQPATPSAPSSAASGSSRPTDQQYGEGGSKRCDQLSGAEKQACMQDEGAKTDRKSEPAAAAPGSAADSANAASGSSAPSGSSTATDTQSND